MEWIRLERKSLERDVNKWFLNPFHGQHNSKPVKGKIDNQKLSQLRDALMNFSLLDVYSRLKSESKVFDRIYIQSRFQIRSFPYVKVIRKLRQWLRKVFALSLPELCAEIATTKVSQSELITQQAFDSLQWRILAAILLMLEIEKETETLTEYLSQELSVSVFIHFPVLFLSLAASIRSLVGELETETAALFSKLRTFSKLLQFPSDSRSPAVEFPLLPNHASFEVLLDAKPTQGLIPKQKQLIEKLDIKFTSKPQTKLRGTSIHTSVTKPKSVLDDLGF